MGVASQDFRDGAATGASQLAKRIRTAALLGIVVTPALVESMRADIVHTWGGAVHGTDSHIYTEPLPSGIPWDSTQRDPESPISSTEGADRG